jgi:ATP-dependent DNA helicase RecG
MTATPIPRTLSLALNAELDQTIIGELPPGRTPVTTRWLPASERHEAHRFVRERVAAGEQAFIVYPLIEESDAIESPAAVAAHAALSEKAFSAMRVGLLHGRLSPAEKDETMRAFRDGAIDILVCTTVIEVGVDVPNATVMVVEGAERFGLAQLHQLRGRVGRGTRPGTCLLVAEAPTGSATERLEALASSTDGMALAELDLRLRGPGDFLGVRQSGDMQRFTFARHASVDLIEKAGRAAKAVMQADPELGRPEHGGLRRAVAALGSGTIVRT